MDKEQMRNPDSYDSILQEERNDADITVRHGKEMGTDEDQAKNPMMESQEISPQALSTPRNGGDTQSRIIGTHNIEASDEASSTSS